MSKQSLRYMGEEAVLNGILAGRVVIPVRDVTVNVAAAGAGVGFGTVVLRGLPVGVLSVLGAKADLVFETADTDIGATFNGDFSLGSTATADVTLDGTDVNLVPSTAVGPAVARVAPAAVGFLAAPLILDNTDGSLEVNLNVLIDAANIGDGTDADFTVNGNVILLLAVA